MSAGPAGQPWKDTQNREWMWSLAVEERCEEELVRMQCEVRRVLTYHADAEASVHRLRHYSAH
jgi:hypothetical protein